MKKHLDLLKKAPLFRGIETAEIETMLHCLSAVQKEYTKNQPVFRAGDHISNVGIVLSGSIHIIKEDFMGNQSILSEISPGQLFGETYACVQGERLQVSAAAAQPSHILFLDIHRILTVCTSSCSFHQKIVYNLLSILAEKNLMLTQKMEHLTQRTTKDKLLSYLSAESRKRGSSVFDIPFNRQQLADYLAVDRSAMSNELCKLRDQGILKFRKNRFELASAHTSRQKQ